MSLLPLLSSVTVCSPKQRKGNKKKKLTTKVKLHFFVITSYNEITLLFLAEMRLRKGPINLASRCLPRFSEISPELILTISEIA